MAKDTKTNAMRILEQKNVPFKVNLYTCNEFIDAVHVANQLGQEYESSFKTLVAVGKSGEHYVYCVPIAEELDLKKAAKAVGEKSIAMILSRELLPLTGYIHGGCSPVGMKKQFPTVFHETCQLFDTICVSAGKVGFQVEVSPQDLIDLVGADMADVVVG